MIDYYINLGKRFSVLWRKVTTCHRSLHVWSITRENTKKHSLVLKSEKLKPASLKACWNYNTTSKIVEKVTNKLINQPVLSTLQNPQWSRTHCLWRRFLHFALVFEIALDIKSSVPLLSLQFVCCKDLKEIVNEYGAALNSSSSHLVAADTHATPVVVLFSYRITLACLMKLSLTLYGLYIWIVYRLQNTW